MVSVSKAAKTMKDFLGREYGAGDTVLYSSGNNIGFGEVARVTELGNVTIYPIVTSSYPGKRKILLDKRNGARVSPHNKDHWERPWGYIHTPTGKFFTDNEHSNYLNAHSYGYWNHPERVNFKRTEEVYKPYVMEVEVMNFPVTIFNTRQIFKWEGPVPSGEAE